MGNPNGALRTLCLVVLMYGSWLPMHAWAQNYTIEGPCPTFTTRFHVQLPPESDCNHCNVAVTVTAPITASPSTSCPQSPYPLVSFFSGFQVRLRTEHCPYMPSETTKNAILHAYIASIPCTVSSGAKVWYLTICLSNMERASQE